MNDLEIVRKMAPEQRELLFSELQKSLSGEYGGITNSGQRIQKDATNNIGVTIGLGLLGAPLEAPAKLLYPVTTPLRNRLPRRTVGGNGVTYRKITGINTGKVWASVAEASDSTSGRNSRISFNEADTTVTFKTLESENMLTPEAQFGANSLITPGQNFDAQGFSTLALLQSHMISEEYLLLGGNVSALGNVAGVTKTGVTQGAIDLGTLTPATTYYVWVAPLTLQGYYASVQGQVGGVDQQGIGTATEFSMATEANGVAGDESLTVTWTEVRGAVAYAVYLGESSGIANAKYSQTVTTNWARITDVPTGVRPNGTDKTANALDFDGIIPQSEATTAGYFLSLDNATFTGDSTTGVEEIDVALKYFYDTYKVSPAEILVNTAQKKKIDQIVSGSAAPIMRIEASAGALDVKGTIGVKSVMNRYMNTEVPVTVHPFMPPGTALFVSYGLGEYYPNANISSNLEMLLAWDYRRIEFARAKRADEFGIDHRGALVCRAPFALGALTNIA